MSLASNIKNLLNNLSQSLRIAGYNLGDEIESIQDQLTAGNLGITADAADVDSVALGGCFAQDADTTTGVTFGYGSGAIHNGLARVAVAAGTVTLNASSTNYVEVDRSGSVTSNTSAFTSGRFPLYEIVTGVSSIATITNRKTMPTLIGTAGVTGAMLSTEAKTKRVLVDFGGDVSATTSVSIPLGSLAGTLSAAWLVSPSDVAASDTNYYTADIANKGTAGSGTTPMLAATNPNTTKATGGSGLTGNVLRALTLHGTSGNLDVVASSVLVATLTKTGTLTVTKPKLLLEFTFAG